MPVGLLGRKVGMTQVFDDAGDIVPVTVLQAGPCVVLGLRTAGSTPGKKGDGYSAVQLGFSDKARHRASRSERGGVADIGSKRQRARTAAGVEVVRPGCEPKEFIREFRIDGEDNVYSVGQELTVASLTGVSRVDVIGTSKGCGTAGVMKRHNFAGQRASHGVKRVHRHGGSIGQSADPARVLRGTKMPGRYGASRVTVRNIRVIRLDEDSDILLVCGAVPGPAGSLVVIRHTNKLKRSKK